MFCALGRDKTYLSACRRQCSAPWSYAGWSSSQQWN